MEFFINPILLSDGSKVYDVTAIDDEQNRVTFNCVSEEAARRVRDALNCGDANGFVVDALAAC